MTTGDGKALLERQPDMALTDSQDGDAEIEVDAGRKYQSMVGFGAAITDASAHLIQSALDDAQRKALIAELFGPAPGLNFSFTRVVIGASDFSVWHYTFNDIPAGESDPELSRFSIEPAKSEVLPTVREALSANPNLAVMASPWSAPAWMKTTDSLITGTLRDDAYAPFAKYLRRTIEAFAEEGVPVRFVSVQNEPDFEPADYPGMRLSAGQRARLIGEHLGPELAAAGLDAKILEWDHNWDQPQQPMSVLADEKAAPYVGGVAWHCYSGEVSAQSAVRAAYPEKDAYFTECSGGRWSAPWPDAWLWTMRNIVIGATEHWARGAIMWNLALDEQDGPHLGGCGNCRGVVTIDGLTGEITRNPEYYALGHASRFVRAGAYRIGATCEEPTLSCVAFLNPDGERALIVLNTGEEAATFTAGEKSLTFSFSLPASAAVTFVWR